MQNIEIIVLLLFGVMFLTLISYRYHFPLPVVLVLSGLGISLVPGLPPVTLKSEVLFLIFLPPLLYSDAWNLSWNEFKANVRAIALASIGLVFFTTVCVGAAIHQLIPQFSWAQSFLLGAIISPTDAVASISITKGLGLHPRLTNILESESLINDASGLITYKYALGAVLAGSFSLQAAGLDFLKVFAGGIAVGVIIGYLMFWLHKNWVHDSIVDVTLTFLTPFAAYLLAEKIHVSGVLAIVISGLYLSYRANVIFSHQSRIEAHAVWGVVSFVLNSLVFVLVGLQLKIIIKDFAIGYVFQLILYGIVISLIALLIRLIWTYPATLLPRLISKKIRETEGFEKKHIWVFTLAGMRGIVSMAAALAIPVALKENVPFPYRSEIIFLTFCIILFTIVVQGLALPHLIKKLKLPKHSIVAEEYKIRSQLIDETRKFIDEELTDVSKEIQTMLHTKYEVRHAILQQTNLPAHRKKKLHPATELFNEAAQIELKLLKQERQTADNLRRQGVASEEVLRKIEREIDLEEARLRLELYPE